MEVSRRVEPLDHGEATQGDSRPARTTRLEETVIGRIQRVRLRDLWSHEALEFTTWLERNIDELSEAAGLPLTVVEREGPVGTFNVDLVAEDDEGVVVIENQLEKSDHDHLGKLLTYLVGVQARKAIWIVAEPRPEHLNVINWLNESSSADFYLLKLEAIRIGNSDPAPLLTKVAWPSEEIRETSAARQEWAEREKSRYRFFAGLLERAKPKTQLHANISPGKHNYVAAGAGITGVTYLYGVRQRDARVELYIDTPDPAKNRQIFNTLKSHQVEIESVCGFHPEWVDPQGTRACRILKTFESGGWRTEDTWELVYEDLTEAMARLERALAPRLRAI